MSCSKKISNQIISLTDGAGKCKMCFHNKGKNKVTLIRVDNCLIKSGKRCDFMIIDFNKTEHYIELKGKEVSYACEQIEETIKIQSSNLKKAKHSYVVSTACPLTTTECQIQKVKFKKKYNSTLTIKNKYCEHSI